MNTTVHVGDCREVMREMEPESFTAIVTDPPYGLSFMGKDWDRGVPGVDFWTEALRVLKPGGMLLAFGGTRTFHRLACAIEDAGFEIRDCLSWLYGNGFPKSLDISKAIDRRRDDTEEVREVCRWVAEARDAAGVTNRDIDEAFGFNGMAGHWTSSGTQPAVPKLDQVPKLLELLGVEDPPEEIAQLLLELNGRKGEPGENWWKRERVGEHSGPAPGIGGERFSVAVSGCLGITAPATEAAQTWHGWGTALKPSWEPCILAMKPLAGTFAANAIEHGVAGVNVEGCRVGNAPSGWNGKAAGGNTWNKGNCGLRKDGAPTQSSGRWPANLVLDEEAAAMLDEQASDKGQAAPLKTRRADKMGRTAYGKYGGSETVDFAPHDALGGASRFFYTAKAASAERHGDDGTGRRAIKNIHPTVKPLDLMQWLVRLVKMPSGTRILDPFCGSGSTLIAAAREGVDSVGIELDSQHAEIARVRFVQDSPMFNTCELLGAPLEERA